MWTWQFGLADKYSFEIYFDLDVIVRTSHFHTSDTSTSTQFLPLSLHGKHWSSDDWMSLGIKICKQTLPGFLQLFWFFTWCCLSSLRLEQCSETGQFRCLRCSVVIFFYSSIWQCWQFKQIYPGPNVNTCLIVFDGVGGWVRAKCLSCVWAAWPCGFCNSLNFSWLL